MLRDRKYELMFILRPDLKEEDINKYIKDVKDLITKLNGRDLKEEIWGKREFAYPINDYKYGFYVLNNFTMDTKEISKVKDMLNLKMEDIIRHLITEDEKEKYIKKFQIKEEAKAKKRALRPPKEEDQDKQESGYKGYRRPRQENSEDSSQDSSHKGYRRPRQENSGESSQDSYKNYKKPRQESNEETSKDTESKEV